MSKPAARAGDNHICPMVTGLVPHVGGPILPPGCPTVLLGGMPAACGGDMVVCIGPVDSLLLGSPTVHIEKKLAARMGDSTAHGGTIVMGCPTILIGDGGFSLSINANQDGSISVGKNIRIEGIPEFQSKTIACLAIIDAMPSAEPNRPPQGKTTLNELDSGKHEITIIESFEGNSCEIENFEDAQNPKVGSQSTVKFNTYNEAATAADPKINRPTDVGLHHELVHANHISKGELSTEPATNEMNPNKEEENTIQKDNIYRKDRGIPERANHDVL